MVTSIVVQIHTNEQKDYDGQCTVDFESSSCNTKTILEKTFSNLFRFYLHLFISLFIIELSEGEKSIICFYLSDTYLGNGREKKRIFIQSVFSSKAFHISLLCQYTNENSCRQSFFLLNK